MVDVLTKKIYPADKISGIEANNFCLSIIGELIKVHNANYPYKFDFYGLSIDLLEEKSIEWIDNVVYSKTAEKIISEYSTFGNKFFADLKNKIGKEDNHFRKYCYNLSLSLPLLSERELIESFDKFMQEYLYAYSLGTVTFLYEQSISHWLNEEISTKNKDSTNLIGGLLKTNYESFMIRAEKVLLQIKKQTNFKKKTTLVNKFKKEFYYFKSNYRIAPVLTDEMILDLSKKAHVSKNGQVVAVRGVALSDREKKMITLLKDAEVLRDKRKEMNLMGSFTLARYISEVVKRKNISAEIANRAFWFEYPKLLEDTKSISKKLTKRTKASYVYSGEKLKYLEYEAFVERQSSSEETTLLKGVPASVGTVEGTVYKILSSRQFAEFPVGGVLVAEMTRPDFMPLMKIAKAIITEEGGLTSHAAIVARELKIPCIVGAKIATKVLSDGDVVEVNANHAVVTIIEKAK